MSYDGIGSSQSFYQRGIGAAYLMTMQVGCCEETQRSDYGGVIDSSGKQHPATGRGGKDLCVVLVFLRFVVSQHDKGKAALLLLICLDHLKNGVFRLRPCDDQVILVRFQTVAF